MRALRLIQIASAGYTQLLGLDLPRRGVRACNALGVFDIPIAEWNVAMMVNLLRDLRGMIRNQEQGVWDRDARFQRELRGLTVGFWGYGGIGRETARLTRALGMRIHVLTRNGSADPRTGIFAIPGTGDPEGILPDRVFGVSERFEFLAGLDFLVVALPLTPATEGIVGEAELSALPSRAFVLNPARGPLIREQALLDALRGGSVAGAALDAHWRYPLPPEHPLWRMPNVLLTPHISGSSLGSHYLARTWEIFRLNLAGDAAGQPLLNELTPSQLRGE
jgi:phosphoglycerate dehydrogenase-like enzyme